MKNHAHTPGPLRRAGEAKRAKRHESLLLCHGYHAGTCQSSVRLKGRSSCMLYVDTYRLVYKGGMLAMDLRDGARYY